VIYHLEAGHYYYQIYSWNAGHECFKKAVSLTNLNFELIGLYGKRTKYQQKEVAQLFLKVNTDPQLNESGCEALNNKWLYANSDLDPNYLPRVTLTLTRQ
jgi:hypothetical protein